MWKLWSAGASRVYAGMRSPSHAAKDGKVVPIGLDVTNAAQVADAAGRGRDVQILVNNAGILLGQPLLDASQVDAAELEMRVNYFGTPCRVPSIRANPLPAMAAERTKHLPVPNKIPPNAVAKCVVDALELGKDDVYPGEAAEIAMGLQHDAKADERQFAALAIPS